MSIEGALPIGTIWRRENRVSSEELTMEVAIEDLVPEMDGRFLELFGKFVKVDGTSKLNGIFNYGPFQDGGKVTQDGFDQVGLYCSLGGIQKYLGGLGIDIQKILGSQHDGKPHQIVAHANAVTDLNAWYDGESDDLTFGTSGGKWHLASDRDIAVHEAGHMALDHINPRLGNWWSGEGRAIHEGVGDGLAALYHDDPELSEDFAAYQGGVDSKTDGLRTVKNNLTLSDVGSEEHDRGQVYAGFFWSVKERLEALSLSSRQAADITLQLLFAHSFQYNTSKPAPLDFVNAMIAGAQKLSDEGKLCLDLETVKSIITEEAERRGLMSAAVSEPEPWGDLFATIEEMEERYGEGGLVRFVPEDGNQEQRFYQEQYRTSQHGYIDVVGHGAVELVRPGGENPVISARDVRIIRQGDIDETVNIDLSAALGTARTRARAAFIDAEHRKDALESLFSRKAFFEDADYRARLAAAQMDYRIAEVALGHLAHSGKSTTPPARLVILPDSNELFYEINVGLGLYYINAKTGEARFERDVFVN